MLYEYGRIIRGDIGLRIGLVNLFRNLGQHLPKILGSPGSGIVVEYPIYSASFELLIHNQQIHRAAPINYRLHPFRLVAIAQAGIG